MIGNALLNEIIVANGIHEPGLVLDHLREGIIKSMQQNDHEFNPDGLDISLFSIDEERSTLQFAGAQNPLWLVRDGYLMELKGEKQPIGVGPRAPQPFRTQTLALERGDSIYAFTDGYVDQFGGPKGKKFKTRAFRQLLLSMQPLSLSAQRQILEQTINHWRGSLRQVDDMCVMGLRV